MSNTLVYLLDGKIYINLTNRCTNDCIFCLRNDKDDVCGQTLWLDDENSTANDVIEQLEKIIEEQKSGGQEGWLVNEISLSELPQSPQPDTNLSTLQPFNSSTDIGLPSCPPALMPSEIIFCGYGEPMLKFDILKEVSKYIKENYPETKIRVNTNGHANFVEKRNVVPELKGLVDEFSVSLNGSSEEEYNELSQPKFENAYEEMKKFIKACSDEGISVVASVVEGYKGRHLDLKKCEKISTELGAKFRVREWIKNGY